MAADIVGVAAGRCGRRARRGGIYREAERCALGAFIACRIRQAVGKAVVAIGQRGGGRERACAAVVSGSHQGAIDIQLGAVGQADADKQTWRGVVCRGSRVARVGAGLAARIVGIATGRCGGLGRRGGVHREADRCALGAFIACRIRQAVRKAVAAIAQRGGGRERACAAVVGGSHQRAVDIQLRRVGQASTDIDAGRGVVCPCSRVAGAAAGDAARIIGVATGSCGGLGRWGGVHRECERWALGAFIACRIGQAVGEAFAAIAQRDIGRERAGAAVVGGRHQGAVDIQLRRVRQATTDIDAGRGVVGGGSRVARVGAGLVTDIVDVAAGSAGGCDR